MLQLRATVYDEHDNNSIYFQRDVTGEMVPLLNQVFGVPIVELGEGASLDYVKEQLYPALATLFGEEAYTLNLLLIGQQSSPYAIQTAATKLLEEILQKALANPDLSLSILIYDREARHIYPSPAAHPEKGVITEKVGRVHPHVQLCPVCDHQILDRIELDSFHICHTCNTRLVHKRQGIVVSTMPLFVPDDLL